MIKIIKRLYINTYRNDNNLVRDSLSFMNRVISGLCDITTRIPWEREKPLYYVSLTVIFLVYNIEQ